MTSTSISSPFARPFPTWTLWLGRVLSALPVAMLTFSAVMKLNGRATEVLTGHLGYPASSAITLGILELACTLLYAIPKTAVLGAILLTGYLGGAIATHFRLSEGFVPTVVLGVVLWLALFLRDERVRTILPLR